MKHDWVKHPVPDKYSPDFTSYHICSVCKCDRLTYLYHYRTKGHIYQRGMRIFSVSDGEPECVDWDAEDLKTID